MHGALFLKARHAAARSRLLRTSLLYWGEKASGGFTRGGYLNLRLPILVHARRMCFFGDFALVEEPLPKMGIETEAVELEA
jgi:hypothetical protein